MEEMRLQIEEMVEYETFSHAKTTNNAMNILYQAVWQGARDYYCKHSPGAKFPDLNGQEQVCAQLTKISSH